MTRQSGNCAYALSIDITTAYQVTAETLQRAHAPGAANKHDMDGIFAYQDTEDHFGTKYLSCLVRGGESRAASISSLDCISLGLALDVRGASVAP